MADRKDYTRHEIEALAALAMGSMLDDWYCWSDPPDKPDELFWRLFPEMARDIEDLRGRFRRINLGCRSLYRRGLVERRRSLLGSRGYAYRLIPMLRDKAAQNPERQSAN